MQILEKSLQGFKPTKAVPAIELTSGDIRAMKAMCNKNAWKADYRNSRAEHVETLLPSIIEKAMIDGLLRVGKEQSDKGLAWLKGIIWTPRGVLSRSKVADNFRAYHHEVVRNFDHFELVEFASVSTRGRPFHVPVYQVVAKNGDSFCYMYGSWQSGAGLEVWL